MSEGFSITINGEAVQVAGIPPTTTLLDFLRNSGRTGTKLGCAEGDCGACTVSVVDRNGKGEPTYRAINSCIALVPMFAGREIWTVEGLARGGARPSVSAKPTPDKPGALGQTADGPSVPGDHAPPSLHPVQAAMADHYGSQCGFCTPGFVVSMFEGYYRSECQGPAEINGQLCGNLCRCTGYRPIRDAAAAAYAGRSPASLAHDPFAQRLQQPLAELAAVDYAAGSGRFFRPTSLADLFALKAAHPTAQLVAGATEIGVELNKKFRSFPALISVEGVPELTEISATAEAWRIGASATLTTVEEALAGEYPSLTHLFSVFAARQIRNRATLGGNLVTASPIGDSAPVLLSLDASVVLASATGERTIPLAEYFTGYRKTVLQPGEVMRAVILPRGRPAEGITRRSEFFKVSHRRELDISIVAAAFCVESDAAGVVLRARIAYGGVAAMSLRARQAEAALEGKTIAGAAEAVAHVLSEEFKPIDDVRAGAVYRRGLAASLWMKFAAGIAPEIPGAVPPWPVKGNWPQHEASRDLRHESAVGHATGGALYVDDLARRRPMLEVWPICSPHAHAKIKRRDATRARSFPGVAAVLLAEDIPGENNVGVSRHDETLFADVDVRYHGHLIGVVIAETVEIARAAVALVEVEYEPLPAIIGIAAAIAQNSYHTDPHVLARGDVEAAMARAPLHLEGEFEFGGQEHFYLETQAAWAEAGDDDDVFICSSTQHPSEIQTIVGEVIHRPKNRVVVQAPRMGGGFGGKETQGNTSAAIVALGALKTGRPVRVQWDRDLDITLTGKRHPFYSKFKIGFAPDGKILAAEVELVSDGGWSLDLSQPVLDRALFHLDNGYYLPAVRFTGRVASTHVTSHTAFRGFGGPQGVMVIEEIIDRVARSVGLPPEVVRQRNLYHGTGETNTTHYLEDIGDNRLQKMWGMALEQSQFAARRAEIDGANRAGGQMRRGLAITPVKFGISFTLTHYNQAGSLVLIYTDGTVQVSHGGTEMGQGLHTKMQGIAMRELGLPASSIRMMKTTTDKVPNTSATAASSGADLNGMAVLNACVILRERLAPIAAKLLAQKSGATIDPGELTFAGGRVFPARGSNLSNDGPSVTFAQVCYQASVERVSLSAVGYYKTPGIYWDWKTASGRPFHYYACGVAVAEVEVDGYTGMSRTLKVDLVHDVGDSLNPSVDRGQIEGAFVQGMGWLTSEELKWNQDGRLLTHSASTYQIPAISDTPVDFNVTLLPDAAQSTTIHGSKAVGEPPFMLAFSVREAIRDAVASFAQPGAQIRLASPATGEAIFTAIQAVR